MSWNYRLVRYAGCDDEHYSYGLHEVYYDEDGEPCNMTENVAGFIGDTPEEVRCALAAAMADLALPVFDEPAAWRDDAGGKQR